MQVEQRLFRSPMCERQIVERAIRKYAIYYARKETDEVVELPGSGWPAQVQMYSAYANLLVNKNIERLTYVLAVSSLALAVVAVISLLLRP